MRSDGTFIAIEVDDSAATDAELARALSEACPVDIFDKGPGGEVAIVRENVDECVLCRLCLDAAESHPSHPVKVIKLYDGEALLV
jgi:ferredoxin-like protein FixX